MAALSVVALAACGGGDTTVQNRSTTPDPPARVADCEARLEHGTLTLAIHNRTDAPRTLAYHRPYMELQLEVTAGGTPRTIAQPPIDMPVEPAQLVVPAHGTADLTTPIRLRFATDPGADTSPFTWVISGDRAAITAKLTLRFDGGKTEMTCAGPL